MSLEHRAVATALFNGVERSSTENKSDGRASHASTGNSRGSFAHVSDRQKRTVMADIRA